MSILDSLENSGIGTWVTQSGSGFYILLAFHSIGMGLVVGVMMVVSMRVLGLLRGISPAALPKLAGLSWYGFWINAISGALLFTGEANKMFYNWSFRWKIICVVVGMFVTYQLTRNVLKPAAAGDTARLESQGARTQAIVLMLIWAAAIFCGRWIAYLGQMEVPG